MIADQDDILPDVLSSVWENEGSHSVWSPSQITISEEMEDAISRLVDTSQLCTVDENIQSSVTSSECDSEDLYTDLESNLLRLSENLTSPLFYGCDSNESVFSGDGIQLSDSELEVNPGSEYNLGTEAASDVVIPSVSCSPENSPVLRRRQWSPSRGSMFESNTKAWSDMSSDEQLSVVQDLTEVVSQHLGLREQLDVIRIINPAANVSTTDTEFVIDLESLNDTKLRQVRQYILQLQHSLSVCSGRSGSHTPLDTCNEYSSSGSMSSKNTPKKKQQRRPAKERSLRQRKDRRQERKEKRSGLFVKEEVLSLQMPEQLAEVDIDILT